MFSVSPFVLMSVFSIITAVTALWLSLVAWRQQPAPGTVTLMLLMAAVAVWAGAAAILWGTFDPGLRQLAAQLAYIGIAPAPVLCFLFVLIHTGYGRRPSRTMLASRWLLLWVIPVLTLCLAFGYPWSRLLWKSFASDPDGRLAITYGPWILVHAGYSWFLLIAAAWVMSLYAFTVHWSYRRRALMVVVAVLVPLVLSVVYVFRLLPGVFFDFTYLGMLLGAVILLIATKRGRLLVMRPIPSTALLEQMTDAILVLNAELLVVDCNRAAWTDLGLAAMPRGRALSELLDSRLGSELPEDSVERWSVAQLIETFTRMEGGDGYLTVIQPRLRHLHWRVSPLGNADAMPGAGWLLVWRDMTEERLNLAMLYEQERALRLVAERQQQESQQAQHIRSLFEDVTKLSERAFESFERGNMAAGTTALVHLRAIANHLRRTEGLKPPSADSAFADSPTFLAAMAAFLQDYRRVAKCNIDFVCTDPQVPELLSPWLLVQLVRLLQELLEGICEQVAVDSLQILLAAGDRWVTLAILFTCAAGRHEDQRASTPALAKVQIERWLQEASIQQRLAAADGQFAYEAYERTGRVTINLPRSNVKRRVQLLGQRVLLGTATSAQAKELGTVLEAQGMQVVGTTSDVQELIVLAGALKPQLILADLSLVNLPPTAAIPQLRSSATGAKLIVFLSSVTEEENAGWAVRQGADGYLLFTPGSAGFVDTLADLLANDLPLSPRLADELLAPAPPAAKGRIYLTDRQHEILGLIVRGFTYREIAMQLYLGERTVRYEAQEIRTRMQVATRGEMIEFALQYRLIG